MNQKQATLRVEQLAKETAKVVAPGMATTVRDKDPSVSGCGGQFGNKVNVGYNLLLPKVSAERSRKLVVAAKAYFDKQGYTINSYQTGGGLPGVNADTQDGFHVDVTVAMDGTPVVGAGSGCVEPA